MLHDTQLTHNMNLWYQRSVITPNRRKGLLFVSPKHIAHNSCSGGVLCLMLFKTTIKGMFTRLKCNLLQIQSKQYHKALTNIKRCIVLFMFIIKITFYSTDYLLFTHSNMLVFVNRTTIYI